MLDVICKVLIFTQDQVDPDDPYTSLQGRAGDLYQTISSVHHQHDTRTNSASNEITVHLEINERETDPSYENL